MRYFIVGLLLFMLPFAPARADPTDVIADVVNGISDSLDKARAMDPGEAEKGAKAGTALRTVITSALLGSGCTRHLYNHSGFTWEVMPNETLRRAGMCALLDQCKITPGLTTEIRFPNWTEVTNNDEKAPAASIRIVGYSGWNWGSRGGVVFDHNFGVEADGNCIYLRHDGNTGNVTLNNPAKGDIQTCGQLSYKCDTAIAEPVMDGKCPTCRTWCANGKAVTIEEFERGACRGTGGKNGLPPG